MDARLHNSSAYALLFLRSVDLPSAQALAGTGLNEGDLRDSDYISAADMARILHNIQAVGLPPGWAARTGGRLGVSAHGPLGFAALSAPTVGAALQVMADYQAARLTTIEADLQQTHDRYQIALTDISGDPQFGRWLCEAILKVIAMLVETLVGHPVGENIRISFACPAHDYVDALEEIYGSSCQFDAASTAISIPASWRHIPSPLYDEATYRANIAKCRDIIHSQNRLRDPVQQVRSQLASFFDHSVAGEADAGELPGLEQLAAAMHVAPRTLIRHLKQRDTSYKALLEQARRQYAEELLSRAHLSVADVGHLLGYREPANFGRAFRNWYGVSPAAWRRGQR